MPAGWRPPAEAGGRDGGGLLAGRATGMPARGRKGGNDGCSDTLFSEVLPLFRMRVSAMNLDYAEDQVRPRRPVTMAEWADKLDTSLSLAERDVLTHAGRLQMDVTQKLAAERFEVFDANRCAAEALAADEADIAQLEEMEKTAKKGRSKRSSDA